MASSRPPWEVGYTEQCHQSQIWMVHVYVQSGRGQHLLGDRFVCAVVDARTDMVRTGRELDLVLCSEQGWDLAPPLIIWWTPEVRLATLNVDSTV